MTAQEKIFMLSLSLSCLDYFHFVNNFYFSNIVSFFLLVAIIKG
jgi:hypothetical protein